MFQSIFNRCTCTRAKHVELDAISSMICCRWLFYVSWSTTRNRLILGIRYELLCGTKLNAERIFLHNTLVLENISMQYKNAANMYKREQRDWKETGRSILVVVVVDDVAVDSKLASKNVWCKIALSLTLWICINILCECWHCDSWY